MLRLKTALVLAVRYLFLTRYSWLVALLLIALVPLSLDVLPRLLANLFVFDLPEQIFHVSWLSMWCAATVMETLHATTMNAHLRFDDYRIATERFREAWGIQVVDDTVAWYRSRAGWMTLLLGLAVAIGVWYRIMSACIESTVGDPAATWNSYVDAANAAALRTYCWQRAGAGLIATVTMLGLLNGLMILAHERRTRSGDWQQPLWQRSLYACLDAVLGPGYLRTETHADSHSLHIAPGRGRTRPTHRFAFRFDQQRQQADELYDGLNVLVTTAMQRSTDELFTKFKQQSYAEHANHIFKGPLAVRPVFLQNAHRVEALVFLMLMSLTMYFVLQRTYRATCAEDAPTRERRTTTRTILSEFAVFMLLVTRTRGGRVVQPLQPTPEQRSLLQRLGLSTPAQLLCHRLPRPPN